MSDNRQLLFLETLDLDTERRWLDYWRAHKHASWRQHPAHGQIRSALGDRMLYVLGILNEKVALVGSFSYGPPRLGIGAAEAVCLRGPVFDDAQFAEWCLPQINDYFRSLKVGSVRIGPYWLFPEAEGLERSLSSIGYIRLETETHDALGRRVTACVDISRSDEELRKSFNKSARYEIKHAERLGLEYRLATTPSEARDFFTHLDKRDEERGISRMSREETEAIIAAFIARNEIGAIINAYHDNSLLGGLFVVRGGKTAFTSKFVVTETSKQLFPTLRIAPSIFYKGMLWAKSQGCEVVDLEGYSTTDRDPSDLAFVNRYKAGFCPIVCQSLCQYYCVCNQVVYRVQSLILSAQRAALLPQRLSYKVRFALKKRMVERQEGKK